MKGMYFRRIAMHDLSRDRYGAVEMLLADVKHLTAPGAPAAAEAPAPVAT